MDFTKMDISAVATGISSDGTGYLQLFLQEYTALFKDKVTPSCPKCLSMYLNRYKNHFKEMENKCNYRLHARYENIPLEFGSPILVNNANITDAYAEKLFLHKDGERYFTAMPEKKIPFTAEIANLKKAAKRVRQTKKKDTGDKNTPDKSNGI